MPKYLWRDVYMPKWDSKEHVRDDKTGRLASKQHLNSLLVGCILWFKITKNFKI